VHTAVGLYKIYDSYSKSAAGKFDYVSATLGALDLVSDYLNADAKAKYQEYRPYAEDAVKLYGLGKSFMEAGKDGKASFDWGGAIQSVAQMIPALQVVVGPVYTIGQGSANNHGGTSETIKQIQINQETAKALTQAYLSQAGTLSQSAGGGQEDLATSLPSTQSYWAHQQAEYQAQQVQLAALKAEQAKGLTDSGAYDSRVMTGQMTDAQVQAERNAWNAGRGSGNANVQSNGSQGGSNGPQNPGGVNDDSKSGKTAAGSEDANKTDQDQKGKDAKTDYIGVALNAVAKSMFIGALMPDKQIAKSIGEDAAQGAETAAKTTAKGVATAAEIGKEKTEQSMDYWSNQAKKAGKGIAESVIKAKNNVVTTDKKVIDEIVEFSGYGPDKYYNSVTNTVQTSKGNVGEVDMKLDYYNVFQNNKDVNGKSGKRPIQAMADGEMVMIFANKRWNRATDLASDEIARMIDDKQDNVIYVPGVNDTFMSDSNIRTMASKLNVPKGCVLVIGHSAGTEAIAKAMAKSKRNKSEVYYLILSPRMTPKEYGKYLEKGNVPAKQVMTVNSVNDIPHWTDPRPEFTNSDKDYNRGPAGAHVFIENANDTNLKLGHSCPVEALSNSEIYEMKTTKNKNEIWQDFDDEINTDLLK